MGCDIHAHVEIKYKGKWEHYSVANIDRWYKLFGVMAGVRGDGPSIIAPRGIPEDVSVVTKLEIERWDGDAHTHSWFGKEELSELEKWARTQKQSLEGDILNCYVFGDGIFGEQMEGVEDVRLVFWFDN